MPYTGMPNDPNFQLLMPLINGNPMAQYSLNRMDSSGYDNFIKLLKDQNAYQTAHADTAGYKFYQDRMRQYQFAINYLLSYPEKAKDYTPGSTLSNALANPTFNVDYFKLAYPNATNDQAVAAVKAAHPDTPSAWNQFRDAVEAGAVGVFNYYLPGSAALTSGLTSTGAQDLLNSPGGQALIAVSGAAGANAGNTFGIPGAAKAGNYVGNITNSTILANATTGAIQGAGWGAINAAATGGNIGQGALKGAEFGAASAATTTALQGPAGLAQGQEWKGWQLPDWMQLPQGTDLLGRFGQGVSALGGTFAGAEASGSNRQEALEKGLISGGAAFLFPTDPEATKAEKLATAEGRELARMALSRYIQSTSSGGTTTQPQGTNYVPPVIGGEPQAGPGSAALAQALRVGDAGAPIFGGASDEKGKKPTGWNVESLRYMG